MPVTTREYNISEATPANVIIALEQAFTDLGWHDSASVGYLTTFTNTPGSVVQSQINKRYLVTQSMCTSTGSSAVFDVLRNISGSISAVTLVEGGERYSLRAFPSLSFSGAVVTGLDTSGLYPGMIATRLWGTAGTLAPNTVIRSVDGPNQITIDRPPFVAVVSSSIQFADVIMIASSSISGSSYDKTATLISGSTFVTVTDNTNLAIGQIVSGSGIIPYATVTGMAGNVVVISAACTGSLTTTLNFSDSIAVTVTGLANVTSVSGFASASVIANVATNTNLYVGAPIWIASGSVTAPTGSITNGAPFISNIIGSGPYTVQVTNRFNNFTGFVGTGSVLFNAVQGNVSESFDKDIWTSPLASAWSVKKSTNPNVSGKRLGITFWNFFVTVTAAVGLPTGGVTPVLYVRAMPGFNPNTNVSQGVSAIDFFNTSFPNQTAPFSAAITVASNTQVPIRLRVRQSQFDPNFASFSFFEAGNNNRNPIIIARYNNSYQPWDLNDVFLGGVYELFPLASYQTNDVGIVPRLRMSGMPKRMAEAGYGNYFQANTTTFTYTNTYFRTMSGNRQLATPGTTYDGVAFYTRKEGDFQNGIETIAIYKNVPINPYFAPVPYYLPEDFIVAEVPYGNVNIGDTITVSPSEIYTVIQTSINQVTYTSLVYAARTT